MKHVLYAFLVLGLFFNSIASVLAQESENYEISPEDPWGDIEQIPDQEEAPDSGIGHSILMYLPNRLLDLLDIFRADVGVGPAVGGVVRITKYGQAGLRTVAPLSARVGLFGRKAPVMLEKSSELGIGPAFKKSKERKVCAGELGAGVDIIIVGAYVGICADEVLDFLGGIFFSDFQDDDLAL